MNFRLSRRACIVLVFCAATAIGLPAQTFKTLVNFDGSNGGNPIGTLVQGPDGSLYGTTYVGGAYDYGTVFKITSTGKLTTLSGFCNPQCGAYPQAGLAFGTNAIFYGTTSQLGMGGGTVFKITPKGTLTTLHIFDNTDGTLPAGTMVQGTDGDFYGTTFEGGVNSYGTVFKITPNGVFSSLYSFGYVDGVGPVGLMQASDGNFYGATQDGGSGSNCTAKGGCGTIFRVTRAGAFASIYSFCSEPDCTDGEAPSGLMQGVDGNFYGTTEYGGTSANCGGSGCGTVFKITPGGKLTTLHSFVLTDGALPTYYPLLQATDGNFYGTTYDGGKTGYGTVFEVTPTGTLTTLHSFKVSDGANPDGGLVQSTDGSFYGMTLKGGEKGCVFGTCGTVFSLSVGLGPFVQTVPTSGKVGAKVLILGTNLTGATSVTFNGTAATFSVVSKSEIKTTVPTGATTGTVEVTTPKGALKSNGVFRVTK